MYKKINKAFLMLVIEFILVTFTLMVLQKIKILENNTIFHIISLVILYINIAIIICFIVFYAITGIVLLFKVIKREKITFFKRMLVELLTLCIIMSIITFVFKLGVRTYISLIIMSTFFSLKDIVKEEMHKIDTAKN